MNTDYQRLNNKMCDDAKCKRIKHELERTDKGLRSIHVEEARRKTKEDFNFFIEKAHDKDIQAEIALKRHRIDQKYYADIVRADQRCRKIAQFHAASDRNDREGYLRDLKRTTDQYDGLGSRGFDVCRSGKCFTDQYHDDYYEEYYDEDGQFYDEDGQCYNENGHTALALTSTTLSNAFLTALYTVMGQIKDPCTIFIR